MKISIATKKQRIAIGSILLDGQQSDNWKRKMILPWQGTGTTNTQIPANSRNLLFHQTRSANKRQAISIPTIDILTNIKNQTTAIGLISLVARQFNKWRGKVMKPLPEIGISIMPTNVAKPGSLLTQEIHHPLAAVHQSHRAQAPNQEQARLTAALQQIQALLA